MEKLCKLKQLCLSQNEITEFCGLEHNNELEFIDLNNNALKHIGNVSHMQKLTDFWVKENQVIIICKSLYFLVVRMVRS